MAIAIQKFITPDGKEFSTQAQAESHEMFLQTQEVVEEFITAQAFKKVQAGMARKMIPAFLAFQAVQKA